MKDLEEDEDQNKGAGLNDDYSDGGFKKRDSD